MSGGSGGPIIIHKIAEADPVSQDDKDELRDIADRSQVACSRADFLRIIFILWKYLRP